ncbi:hypothetical protein [Streptomyces sp. XD-27]|uniref:hypothetical protein n=1 Tax=Streptomyces sp. XD-27 TaxID=3062779 RepID=UPI0026F42D02|nr:hypothetical protein [Streptomyces sp. XD-27]WKX71241.1 hypothetical protein Q3Y56_16215 [Streptomyces sp. XD-27]
MPMPMDIWRERWDRADRTAAALRNALATHGIPESAYGSIRPVVTHQGSAYVDLGMLREDAAAKVAAVLNQKAHAGEA